MGFSLSLKPGVRGSFRPVLGALRVDLAETRPVFPGRVGIT